MFGGNSAGLQTVHVPSNCFLLDYFHLFEDLDYQKHFLCKNEVDSVIMTTVYPDIATCAASSQDGVAILCACSCWKQLFIICSSQSDEF